MTALGRTPWRSPWIDNLKTVIESGYRQIFFHAFQSDRDVNLESQLRDGQITVRDFVRGLCLSDTFKRSFYGMNSNYKVVRHLVERLLGRKSNKSEEISWSIVSLPRAWQAWWMFCWTARNIWTLSATTPFHPSAIGAPRPRPRRYTVQHHQPSLRRVLPEIYGLPSSRLSGGPSKKLPARQNQAWRLPIDYLPWVAGLANARGGSPSMPRWIISPKFLIAASDAESNTQSHKKSGATAPFFVCNTVIPGKGSVDRVRIY